MLVERSSRLCAVKGLHHEFEPVLAKEHLIADEEGRCAEHAAGNGLIGVVLQLLPFFVACQDTN